ncbi:unnamed protein product, partial [Phaeothamnion confervicola]
AARPPGRRGRRDTSRMLELALEHVTLRMDSFHQEGKRPGEKLLSNLVLAVDDLLVYDTLTSHRPRRALSHWRSDKRHPREYGQKMLTLQLTAHGPAAGAFAGGGGGGAAPGDEYMLKVRLLPLQLSFGQHMIDFLRGF